jgi:hypothetical protein
MQTQQSSNKYPEEPELLTRMYTKVQKLGEGTYGKNHQQRQKKIFFLILHIFVIIFCFNWTCCKSNNSK